ncbi:nitrous oxide reductase accessory protein NosL [Geomonas sp.]|uniref:nitrous oxide reductase accessory protein NosL n=1 Tax=Geomonas sp. TaxID=2651584 RepID=UPI002B47F374|nr:nitrous oxide reductase accessory protein NosL [Geomonas sp.]HJV34037.1 nitrous oxide reductase accessory protein NosL [Geomonas sp.]
MRRLIIASLLIAVVAGVALAASPDLDQFATCKYCGMDRSQYSRSRMLIQYDDGSSLATCSLHCAVVDLAVNIDKTPLHTYVGDCQSGKLIDAETAVWVIGGSRQGVMTSNPKWAFETRERAESFVRENGGTISTFDESVSAAYQDMYRDTKKIRERRKARRGQ